MKIRIYADFNNCDEQYRVRLDTAGSLQDLEQHKGEMQEGMTVLISDGEVEVEARLEKDPQYGIWLGVPNWNTRRDLA